MEQNINSVTALIILYADLTKGFGDVMLNYRYELTGKARWATTAPRLSLIIPTGDVSKGFGTGAWGGQFNFPASKVVTNFLILHANAGYTYYNNVQKTNGYDSTAVMKKNITAMNVGLSTIFVLRKNIHFLCEFIVNSENDFDSFGKRINAVETIVNPGLRFAFDLGKAQIVPGISFPTSFNSDASSTGVFFYLSIEPDFSK